MNKFAPLAALATLATFSIAPGVAYAETTQAVHEATEQAAAPVQVKAGQMLYSAAGYRVAPIYRVTADGNPQIILNGKLVTVPAAGLSDVGGKLTTALTRKALAAAK